MKRVVFVITLLTVLPWAAFAQFQEPVDEPEIRVLDAPQDVAIKNRLSAVLAAMDDVDEVAIRVEAGVVTLSGTVSGSRMARDLMAVAARVEGVVYVQSELEEDVAVGTRVRPVTLKLEEMGRSALQMVPLAVVAILTVVFFWFLGSWAGRRGSWLRRVGLSELASHLGMRVVRTVVTGIGILIALEILDATALFGALLGVAGVVGIAVGFAFRNIVENYLAGILLGARNPFNIGDLIQIGEFIGKVVRLTSRDTVLMTPEGNHLRIPNSVIITSAMTNFTRNPLRCFQFKVGVSVDFDVAVARDLGVKTLRDLKGVLGDPGPAGLVAELGDSTVQLQFSAWVDQRDTDFLKGRSEAIRAIKSAFDKAGIDMPEPIYRIHLRDRGNSVPGEHMAEVKAPSATGGFDGSELESVDVSADQTIDKQVAEDLDNSDEENLLQR